MEDNGQLLEPVVTKLEKIKEDYESIGVSEESLMEELQRIAVNFGVEDHVQDNKGLQIQLVEALDKILAPSRYVDFWPDIDEYMEQMFLARSIADPQQFQTDLQKANIEGSGSDAAKKLATEIADILLGSWIVLDGVTDRSAVMFACYFAFGRGWGIRAASDLMPEVVQDRYITKTGVFDSASYSILLEILGMTRNPTYRAKDKIFSSTKNVKSLQTLALTKLVKAPLTTLYLNYVSDRENRPWEEQFM